MSNGRTCPLCRKDIGLKSVIFAVWPTRLECPHCKAHLTYDISLWRTSLFVVLPTTVILLTISLFVTCALFPKLGPLPLGFALVLFVILWEGFEVLNALWLRSHRNLNNKGTDPTTDPTVPPETGADGVQ